MYKSTQPKMPINILVIGPFPPPIGGIGVSLGILVDLLRCRDDAEIEIVDINEIRTRMGHSFKGLFYLCKSVIKKVRKVDIVTVYCASTALSSLGLLLLIISRILNKPFVVRKAANVDYMDKRYFGFVKGHISHFVIKHADLFLAQTKILVNVTRNRGVSHVKWYPTSRKMNNDGYTLPSTIKSCRRFVYVGHVREYKGINELIQAAEQFEDEIVVDVYGPLFDDIEKDIFKNCVKVKYRGVLSPEDVIPTLNGYDMLLLPTKALSEGYPGAVLEGYSAGLPIITTRCGGIPEIVDETSGIFVEPGDVSALFKAMKTVVNSDEIYANLRNGVHAKRNEFDASTWAERFVRICEDVISPQRV